MYKFPKDRFHDMDKQRTLNLISTSDIDIPIERSDYSYFTSNKTYLGVIRKFEDEVCSLYTGCELQERFRLGLRLHVLPNYFKGGKYSENYCLTYSPKEIVDNIFNILDIDAKDILGKKINYNASLEEYYEVETHIKNALSSVISYYETNIIMLESEASACTTDKIYCQLQNRIDILKEKLKFAKMSYEGIDKILSLYRDRRLTSINYYGDKDNYIEWRNLAQYIAITSLREYEKTGNLDYLVYPYKFYEKCSKKNPDGSQMKYVSSLLLEDDKLDSRFIRFNRLCEKAFTKSKENIKFLLNHKDNDKQKVFETLKPNDIAMLSSDDFGSYLELKTKEYFSRVGKPTIEDLNTQRQLISKIKFYAYNDEFNKHLKTRLCSTDNGTGIVRFVLDNDYIVLDKFFDEDGIGNSIPAKNSAVYILPLDLYYFLDYDEVKVREYKRDDPEDESIERKYHRDGDSYQDAILDVCNYHSISLISADDFIKEVNDGTVIFRDSKKLKKKPKKKD